MRKLLIVVLVSIGLIAWAQNPKKQAPIKPVEKLYNITFGAKGDTFTYINKQHVDSIIRMPIQLIDKAGERYTATAFDVIYAEWGVYEDSTGRDKIMTEYYTLNVNGSQLPSFFADNISSLAKAGDTLTIYRVFAENANASKTKKMVVEASAKKFIIK